MTNPSRFYCFSGAPGEDHSRLFERGDTVLHAPSGTFFHSHGGGDMSLTLQLVTGVGIANLAEVADHQILCCEGAVTHRVLFHGGSELRYVHDLHGTMMELVGKGVRMVASPCGLVSVSVFCPDGNTAPALNI